jgi:nucleotide-binding universal stress UspA family protein
MRIFLTKILLATDGTSHGALARTTAVDMANSTDSELHVVTVAPGYTSYDANILQVVVEQVRKQAEKILDNQVEKAARTGDRVAAKPLRIAERHRAQQIVRVAGEIGAGLIVMGSRGLKGEASPDGQRIGLAGPARP